MKINVRIVRAGVAGASGLLALGGASGCSAPEDHATAEPLASSAFALTTPTTAGTGRLDLSNFYGPDGAQYALTLRDSTSDEFVRVGEELTVSLPGYLVWGLLQPASDLPDIARFRRISATVTLSFRDARSGETSTKTVSATTWRGENFWDASLEAEAFRVPARTDAVTLGVELVDLGPESTPETPAPEPVKASIEESSVLPITVFGGDLPNKTVFLDTEAAGKRTRILEGGDLEAGGNALVAYTDWRADAVIDASSIDKQIGTVKSYGRFGPYVMPIYGEIEYEIAAGYAFDDEGFAAEEALALVTSSALVGSYRKDFERRIALPSEARKVSFYFHVKAFLKIDYSRWPGADRWFGEGRRLVADRYDNPGAAFTNYELAIAPESH